MKRRGRVFISYRRDGGSELARNIRDALLKRQFDVFMDVHDLRAGAFNKALYNEINAATDLVAVLTPNSLDRCFNNPDDWLRLELAHALALKKNVVPILHRRFDWPDQPLPEDLRGLREQSGPPPSHEYFDASMDNLADRFLVGWTTARTRHHRSGVIALSLCLFAAVVGLGWWWGRREIHPQTGSSQVTETVPAEAVTPSVGAPQTSASVSSLRQAPPTTLPLAVPAGNSARPAGPQSEAEKYSDLLTAAAKAGNAETVRALLANGADVNSTDQYGQTALVLAAKAGRTAAVQRLLEKGADVSLRVTKNGGSNGFTALHGAAESGILEIFQALIAKGADTRAADESGYTVLMAAAHGKNVEIVQSLLQAKDILISAKTKTGETALHYAFASKPTEPCFYGCGYASPTLPTKIPRLLLAAGAPVNAESWNHTPLSMAVQNEDVEAVRDLLTAKANPNLVPKNPNARSPLAIAAASVTQEEGDQGLIKLLLSQGADPNLKDDNGKTASQYAAETGHTKSMLLLLAPKK